MQHYSACLINVVFEAYNKSAFSSGRTFWKVILVQQTSMSIAPLLQPEKLRSNIFSKLFQIQPHFP